MAPYHVQKYAVVMKFLAAGHKEITVIIPTGVKWREIQYNTDCL